MVIGIIGGGASGMASALAAAENQKAQVLLFERQARLGRKLLATGNGRCNLDNNGVRLEDYFTSDRETLEQMLCAIGGMGVMDWFSDHGLLTTPDEVGRVYPYSNTAASRRTTCRT